jgi:predicted component of type VI protein secretion system
MSCKRRLAAAQVFRNRLGILPGGRTFFGDGTYEMLSARVYPVYGKVLEKVVDDLPSAGEMPKEKRDAAPKALNEALVTERMRKRDSQKPKLSDDPDVAELQEKGDVPRQLAEKLVKGRRRRAITEMPSHSDKVQ